MVDRKSKLTLLEKVHRYTAEKVEQAIIGLLQQLSRRNFTVGDYHYVNSTAYYQKEFTQNGKRCNG